MRVLTTPNRSVDLLRRMPAFSSCSLRELRLIGMVADEVAPPPGFALVEEGHPATGCFLLIDGEAEVSTDGLSWTIGSGTLVGARTLVVSGTHEATVRTTTATRVFSFGRRGLGQLLLSPSVAAWLHRVPLTVPESIVSAAPGRGSANNRLAAVVALPDHGGHGVRRLPVAELRAARRAAAVRGGQLPGR